MMDVDNYHELGQVYGPYYHHAEFQPGVVISFYDSELGELAGIVLWALAPREEAGYWMPARYIIEPISGGSPEVVCMNSVLLRRK